MEKPTYSDKANSPQALQGTANSGAHAIVVKTYISKVDICICY